MRSQLQKKHIREKPMFWLRPRREKYQELSTKLISSQPFRGLLPKYFEKPNCKRKDINNVKYIIYYDFIENYYV